ncbi:MAG: class I SAM-dependent methyltransferase [Pseudomonadota bacterium]|nr:class I SAM-dependent methyltransferase [Pseudomonadota bacterium]
MPINRYVDEDVTRRRIETEGHRSVVGGLWDVMGALQRDFLISRGLQPGHDLLDVGCGSLRAGRPLVAWLEPSRYYGIDISASLIEAGYTNEIVAAGFADRLPRENLFVTSDFEIPFDNSFDAAIATSVFTHLTLDYLTRCLERLHTAMKPEGRFYATFFEGEGASLARPDGVVTHPDRDPFHFSQAQIRAATPENWAFEWIGDWDHPRDQKMACFTRR